jgi:hypothetical protein
LLKTRRAVGLTSALAVPPPPPPAECQPIAGAAVEGEVVFESRPESRAEPPSVVLAAALPLPALVAEDWPVAGAGDAGVASDEPALSELVVVPRAVLRRPSAAAAAASPSELAKERAGARTHSKVMV